MLSFKEMQILSEAEYSIEDTRKQLNEIVEFFRSQPWHDEAIDTAFVKGRSLPRWLAEGQKVFFIDEDFDILDIPEEYRHDSLGIVKNNKIVFAGRLVYPVMDVRGDVMGFCGWDKFVQPKYLDSRNYGYKAKSTTFYGMEKLEEYYKSEKSVYAVEGIVCCLYLRSIGLQSIALLGSSISPYVKQILKRFEKRLIIIPDNDVIGKSFKDISNNMTAGEHFVKVSKIYFPKATIIQSILDKDVDDSRYHSEVELFRSELAIVAECPYHFFKTVCIR